MGHPIQPLIGQTRGPFFLVTGDPAAESALVNAQQVGGLLYRQLLVCSLFVNLFKSHRPYLLVCAGFLHRFILFGKANASKINQTDRVLLIPDN